MSTQSRFVKASEIPDQFGISKAFAYKLEREGRFPRRFNLSPKPDGKPVTRWLRSDLEAWLADRLKTA